MKSEPLVLERVYDAPIDIVWNALTDAKQMQQWYFQIADFKPVVGFEFHFEANNEDVVYVHLCTVTAVVPGRKIAYSWSYNGYPGYSVVSFELFPEGDKTKLRLTHDGLESFPQDKPDFKRESFTGGWTYFVHNALKNFVERDKIKS